MLSEHNLLNKKLHPCTKQQIYLVWDYDYWTFTEEQMLQVYIYIHTYINKIYL